MKRWIMLAMLGVSALVAGCEEHKEGGTTTAPSGQAAAAPIKDEDLAVEADFDDEAEKQITPANYKSELDTLDKEIAAE